MRINNFEFNNQNLQNFLTRNESKMSTKDFFNFLEKAQNDDPQNFQVRPLWVSDGEWVGEYRVVFGAHFNLRVWQRVFRVAEPIEAVMEQLQNPEVARIVTSNPIYWDEVEQEIVADEIEALAVIQEDLPFVPIYSAGDSFVNVKTVIEKTEDMFFSKGTAVISVDKAGNVSIVKEY